MGCLTLKLFLLGISIFMLSVHASNNQDCIKALQANLKRDKLSVMELGRMFGERRHWKLSQTKFDDCKGSLHRMRRTIFRSKSVERRRKAIEKRVAEAIARSSLGRATTTPDPRIAIIKERNRILRMAKKGTHYIEEVTEVVNRTRRQVGTVSPEAEQRREVRPKAVHRTRRQVGAVSPEVEQRGEVLERSVPKVVQGSVADNSMEPMQLNMTVRKRRELVIDPMLFLLKTRYQATEKRASINILQSMISFALERKTRFT
uniref:Uncharacterized protein n=1 Tax=Cacopsylla melanoneura TaxID=428564 RepID=A0A8D8RHS2_9HEMI